MYTVLAYSVNQRTQEIGVRRALGAEDLGIIEMIARQGLWQLGIGLSVGLVLSVGFGYLLSNQLIGVDPFDPITLFAVTLMITVVTVVATAIPTRRALRIHPMEALRYQ